MWLSCDLLWAIYVWWLQQLVSVQCVVWCVAGEAAELFTGVLPNGYGPPPGFCFDILCSDEPIMDDPRLHDYNVDEKVVCGCGWACHLFIFCVVLCLVLYLFCIVMHVLSLFICLRWCLLWFLSFSCYCLWFCLSVQVHYIYCVRIAVNLFQQFIQLNSFRFSESTISVCWGLLL